MRVIVLSSEGAVTARLLGLLAGCPEAATVVLQQRPAELQTEDTGTTLVLWCFPEIAPPKVLPPGRDDVTWVVWLADSPAAQARERWLEAGASDLWAGTLSDAQLELALCVAMNRARIRAKRASMQRSLQFSRARYRALVHNTLDVLGVLDRSLRIRYLSPAVAAVLGHRAQDLRGALLDSLVHEDDLSELRSACEEVRRHGAPARVQVRVRHDDGTYRHMELLAGRLAADDPDNHAILVSARDVTDRHEFEEMLTQQAFFDALTGLANRVLFMERLEHALAQRARHGGLRAVLFVDLDGFKAVNDDYGHDVGDATLVQLAGRISSLTREGDTAARLGGDEFVLLVESVESHADVQQVAERLVTALRAPVTLDDIVVTVTVSVGIALCSANDRVGAKELIRRADTAMYRAKALGKDRYLFWSPRHDTERPAPRAVSGAPKDDG